MFRVRVQARDPVGRGAALPNVHREQSLDPMERAKGERGKRDLGRAQYMTCRMEADRHAVQRKLLAQYRRLRRAGEVRTVAQRHDVERPPCRQNMAMA